MADPARKPGEPPGPAAPPEGAPLPPPPPDTPVSEGERALLVRLRRGDDRAFAELLRRYQDRVFELGYRMLGDRQEAEDVSQEIFVAVHRALGGFRGESRLSTWIFRVAKNHLLNRLEYLRRRGGGRTDDLDEGLEVAAETGVEAPDRDLERREEQALVQRALAELDEAQRMIVVLRDIEGLGYDEIVQVLDEPLGTVKSRLHRARAALARAVARLEEEGRGGVR